MRETRDPETEYNLNALHVLRTALASGVPPLRLGLTPEESERLLSASEAEMRTLSQAAPHPVLIASDTVSAIGADPSATPSVREVVVAELALCQAAFRRRKFQ